jgi:hypothetical protein
LKVIYKPRRDKIRSSSVRTELGSGKRAAANSVSTAHVTNPIDLSKCGPGAADTSAMGFEQMQALIAKAITVRLVNEADRTSRVPSIF